MPYWRETLRETTFEDRTECGEDANMTQSIIGAGGCGVKSGWMALLVRDLLRFLAPLPGLAAAKALVHLPWIHSV